MALTYNPLLKGFDYIPASQRGDDNPFKVKLRTVPSQELVKLQDGLVQRTIDAMTVKSGSYSIDVCRAGIIDWSGMLDEDGKEISIVLDASGRITDSSLDKLPPYLFEEIANVIVSVSEDPSTLPLFNDSKNTEE